MELRLIVAVAENGVIGAHGALPWHQRADLQRFRRLTMGESLVMGYKTFRSIGRALPGRASIVLSRHPDRELPDGVRLAHSLDDALAMVATPVAWVIGGASLFAETIDRGDELGLGEIHLTRVHAEVEGDVYFPTWRETEWEVAEAERTEQDEHNDHRATYLRLLRKGTLERAARSGLAP